ncbi:MAG: type I-A CRISPR-associated protein Cas7/Csa2 [Desulfurococcaceae archaeon]
MISPPYIRVSGRIELQVSVLTGLGAIGNYNQHATAKVTVNGKLYEVPVMTGNAFKHWHSVYLAEVYEALGGQKLNELCKRGIGLRGYKVDTGYPNLTEADSECEAIEDVCNDIHGLLITKKERSSKKEKPSKKERPFKRDSLFKASFLIPVLTEDNVKIASKFAVQHNRVIPTQIEVEETKEKRKTKEETETRGKEEEKEALMMIFKQEYATALYGFAISANLGLTLTPLYDSNCSLSIQNLNEERKLRIKSAIIALINLLMGSGSKQARALPIARLRELVVAVSNIPIPNLVHGSYPDYVKESLEIMKAYASVFDKENTEINIMCYGVKCKDKVKISGTNQNNRLSIEDYEDLSNLVENLINKALTSFQTQHTEKRNQR